MDCFVAFAPRNDGGYSFAISRRIAPEACYQLPALFEIRGRREDRVLAAPAVSRAICANKSAHEHTGQREHSGVAREKLRFSGLDASTAASGPHDFAVRVW